MGELVEQKVLKSLEGTEHDFLYQLIKACDVGDTSAYDSLIASNQDRINNIPEISRNLTLIKEKVSILGLVELVFQRSKGERNIPFSLIAERSKISSDEVELLAMRTMRLGLIKGVLDEVEQTFRVHWVKPRVLDLSRVDMIRNRLDTWTDNINTTLVEMEQTHPDLFANKVM